MTSFQRIGITLKSDMPDGLEVLSSITSIISSCGSTPLLDAASALVSKVPHMHTYHHESDIDLLIVIGGDGTVFRAIRSLSELKIPLLSINRGTVGFLSEAELRDAPAILPSLLRGEGILDERSVLSVRALRGDTEFFAGYALNEAVIAQGTIARLVELSVTVQREDLTTFRADGVIVSTPTGSTAYSLAAGGPIVHPRLPATILTPINPFSFSQKPIVLPAEYPLDITVRTKIDSSRATTVILTLDGQVYCELHGGDTVSIARYDKTVRFLRRHEDTFFSTLRSKLKWGE